MRWPLIPTFFVAAAVATMIGLGVWQLQRMAWKEQRIAELSAADAYHPAEARCEIDAKPEVRAGRNVAGQTGFRYLVPCGGLSLDIGWSQRPDLFPRVRQAGAFTGQQATRGETRNVLILDRPFAPLEKSELPNPADLPNNHLAYAVQWFFFAGIAALIYVLALRRRSRGS